MDASAAAEPELLVSRRGRLGHLLLQRPRALNALTPAMVDGLSAALAEFAADPAITAVAIEGAGGRAFCAGGDIRLMHGYGTGGRLEEARAFWRAEYLLNIAIHRFAKPYLALIDGIVIGGGVGISLHGSHRVAGPGYGFAMPEVGIGFFPDVGAMHVLSRLPGGMGHYLALTGTRIGRGDAIRLGLATHAVAAGFFPALIEALARGEDVDALLAAGSEPPGEALLARHEALIARCFGAGSLAGICTALAQEAGRGSGFAQETLALIRSRSPTSLAIAFEQLRRGPALGFEEAMRQEFRIVSRVAAASEFYEGVRAQLIDRDQAPRWNPATIEALDPAAVAAFFAPLPDELPVAPAAARA